MHSDMPNGLKIWVCEKLLIVCWEKAKCVNVSFVLVPADGSDEVSRCMRCTVECLWYAGVRQMQSLSVFTSLRCDPGSNGMWLMRAINISDLVGARKISASHTCLCSPSSSHRRWQERRKRRGERGETNKSWTQLLSSQMRTPCPHSHLLAFPPTCHYSPDSAGMPFCFNAMSHIGLCGSQSFSVGICDCIINNSHLKRIEEEKICSKRLIAGWRLHTCWSFKHTHTHAWKDDFT